MQRTFKFVQTGSSLSKKDPMWPTRYAKFKVYIGDVCFKNRHKSHKGMICDMTKTTEANHHVQTITRGLIGVHEGCKDIETTACL